MFTLKRLTTPSDLVKALRLPIRKQDKIEFFEASGYYYIIAFDMALSESDKLWGIYKEDLLVAVGGLVGSQSWFVGSEEAHKYPRQWCKIGRKLVKEFNIDTTCRVNKDNEDVRKWLSIIGYKCTGKEFKGHCTMHFIEYTANKEGTTYG